MDKIIMIIRMIALQVEHKSLTMAESIIGTDNKCLCLLKYMSIHIPHL